MGTKNLKLEILKKLNLSPSYGYELYTLLKDDFGLNSPSELYKCIREMKKNGFIHEVGIEKESGRKREILELSPEGRKNYHEMVYESALYFMDLLSESLITQTADQIPELFRTWGIDDVFEADQIFLRLAYPIEHQVMLLNKIIGRLGRAPEIYIETAPGDLQKIGAYRRKGVKVHFLEQDVRLKDDVVNLAINMAPLFKPTLNEIHAMLKKDGRLLVITLSDKIRSQSKFWENGLYNFLNNVFDDELARKLSESFTSIILPGVVSDNSLKSSEIHEILSRTYESVEEVSLKEKNSIKFMDVYHARGPIKHMEENDRK